MPIRAADIYDPFAHEEVLRIEKIDVLDTPKLRVVFDDGAERVVDFSDTIARSRWFRTLSVPTTFETVEVIHGGRALQWVTGADYCADALRILADKQQAGIA
ncbi:MAG: DUF2442 domain-containing protein [Rhodobacteraceae bacterium]|jgi:hypothetical protein|nr:DUF2442 domain-containing protein [Paracoccaceae bacterium]MBL4556717.1 DUF2442 domain-containing protein [Paracoccaceae bacterium]HBG97898.1 hypothetical protein [Paracoccaceae bacterium]